MNYNTFEKKQDEKSLELDKEMSENLIQPKENPTSILEENEILTFDTFFMVRCFIILVAITFISLNTVYGFALPGNNIDCMMDKIHDLTDGINKFFQKNVQARHALIIISSLFVDFLALFTSTHWACYGKSWRIIISLVLFYGFRALIQVIILLEKFIILVYYSYF